MKDQIVVVIGKIYMLKKVISRNPFIYLKDEHTKIIERNFRYELHRKAMFIYKIVHLGYFLI